MIIRQFPRLPVFAIKIQLFQQVKQKIDGNTFDLMGKRYL